MGLPRCSPMAKSGWVPLRCSVLRDTAVLSTPIAGQIMLRATSLAPYAVCGASATQRKFAAKCWPADHIGRLSQTNGPGLGLGTNWFSFEFAAHRVLAHCPGPAAFSASCIPNCPGHAGSVANFWGMPGLFEGHAKTLRFDAARARPGLICGPFLPAASWRGQSARGEVPGRGCGPDVRDRPCGGRAGTSPRRRPDP